MSLTDTLKNTLSALTEGGLNRYRLDIPSCTALLDVETFSGKEFMSELYYYQVIFTSSDQNISSAQLLTKPATLTMGTGPLMGMTGQKVVHGVVTHLSVSVAHVTRRRTRLLLSRSCLCCAINSVPTAFSLISQYRKLSLKYCRSMA